MKGPAAAVERLSSAPELRKIVGPSSAWARTQPSMNPMNSDSALPADTPLCCALSPFPKPCERSEILWSVLTDGCVEQAGVAALRHERQPAEGWHGHAPVLVEPEPRGVRQLEVANDDREVRHPSHVVCAVPQRAVGQLGHAAASGARNQESRVEPEQRHHNHPRTSSKPGTS